jgi:hypothetical protein
MRPMLRRMDRVRLSEDDWLGMVTDLATLKGWDWMHIRPAMKQAGWRTPIAGTIGKGWPDLVLVRGRRILFVELKGDGGQLTDDQRRVLDVLRSATDDVDVWRPADWLRIVEALA